VYFIVVGLFPVSCRTVSILQTLFFNHWSHHSDGINVGGAYLTYSRKVPSLTDPPYSGPLQWARGSSWAKAPPLAARPWWWHINNSPESGMWLGRARSRSLSFKSVIGWSVIGYQEWGCTRLFVGKLSHTGLVQFVDELGTVCGEVPLELECGFEVLVWSEQHTVCFLICNCVILSSAHGVSAGKHRWAITQSCVTLWS